MLAWRIMITVGLVLALCVLALAGASGSAGATACPVGKLGHQLVLSPRGGCIDPAPPSATGEAVLRAKQDYADTLIAFRKGAAMASDLQASRDRLMEVTGETPASVSGATVSPMIATLAVPSYEQYYDYYCGPATAQDILRFLGPNTSLKYDTVTQAYDSMNGDEQHDQTIFANYFWLATDNYQETLWGDLYMPFTLNNWRLNNWYQSTASWNLNESQAWIDVDTDLNLGHPIAEDVLYDEYISYLPDGFPPGTYQHWDVIFGDNSGFQAAIAQPYGKPTRYPYQWHDWSVVWKAINANNGIVW